ncbi:SulP family inorganic anion transporter [uncultured Microscilla sp.]|uniref:SulP family inorganic anion transporter n=1 Tax=uncultured Microscilla sp. TaxID=432653 RepID=UPI00263788E4|nr:SulP family inorganic anion transporter [uncultured Microscilla sp.]
MIEQGTLELPKDGIAGLRQNWRIDLFAGLLVFMLTLPLCLSTAFASNFPVWSGIISALVAGGIVTFLSGSPLTIKGPTIGFAAVLAYGVQNLGSGYFITGYKYTLVAIIMAGSLQVLLGLLRIGNWRSIIPDSLVYGLMGGIGITILGRQLYFLLGATPHVSSESMVWMKLPNLLPTDFASPFWSFMGGWVDTYHDTAITINPNIAFIGITSLCLMFIFSSIKYPKILPSAVVVLLFGLIATFYFSLHTKDTAHLIARTSYAQALFVFPDFSKFYILKTLEVTFIILAISTLETAVNVKTIDAVDLYRRRSKLNREVLAIGIGNMISGFLGGLPLIATMDESSKNVNNGAKTRWANFFQSLFLLVFVLLVFPVFKYIPKAALSAIVIYAVYRLNSPQLIKDLKQVGKEQLLIYIVTLIATVFLGVLWGVLVGIVTTLVSYKLLGASFSSLFRIKVTTTQKKRKIRIFIENAALASNYPSLRKHLRDVPEGHYLIIDFSKSKVIDYGFMENIYFFAYSYSVQNGKIELNGLEQHKAVSAHPLATRKLIKRKAVDKSKKIHLVEKGLLDERQLDVQGVAAINNARFKPNITFDGVKLQGFHFALGYEIKYSENTFAKFFGVTRIEFSDIFLSKGIRMSEQSHKMSVLLVYGVEAYIPDFTLGREHLLAKLIQSVGYGDIDFDDYPGFSEAYLLKGEKEEEIRALFSRELIDFLEKNQGFNIESRNNNILIYKEKALMNRVEMEDAVEFTENFLSIIYNANKQNNEVAI